jgi:predicted transcriptional regulator
MPIRVAVDIIINHNFNGIPVVSKEDILVGILTKYDLIVNRKNIRNDMTVADVMNKEPLVLDKNMTVDDAIKAFTDHHKVDPIPVIDAERKLIGVISRFDMVKMFSDYGVSFTGSRQIAKETQKSKVLPLFIGLAVLSAIIGFIFYFFI